MEVILQFGLIGENGKIIEKREKDFSKEDRNNIEEVIEKTIISYVNDILKNQNISKNNIDKIGIAAPGTHKNDVIVKAENLGITNFDIVSKLKKYFNTDITLNNDAKCAAMCEKIYGGLKKYDDAIFLCLGTGIGGAVFLGGKLLKAKRYAGFELGHVVLEKNGKKCSCGKLGCIESYCSMRVLKEQIGNRKHLDNITPKDVYEIMKNDFEEIKDIIDEYVENLAIGIANYIDIFEPEAIAIGGSFIYYQDILLERLIKRLHTGKMTFNNDIPEIIIANYGNDAGIIGAVL